MPQDFVPAISHTIQLAVTPDFLLTSVASLLNVLVTLGQTGHSEHSHKQGKQKSKDRPHST